jgi:hypothetical protein
MKHKFFISLLTVAFMLLLTGCIVTTPSNYNALGNWQAGEEGVYTISTNSTNKLSFTYDKGTYPDAALVKDVSSKDLSQFKKLVITVQGMGSIQVRLECDDDTPSKQVSLNVLSNVGTYEWNLLNSSDFLKKVKRIVIVAAPGKETSTGSVEITGLTFGVEVAKGFIIQDDYNNIPSNVNEYNGTDEEFHFNSKWADNGDNVYTIVEEAGITKVTFNKNGFAWAFMRTMVQGKFEDFNYVVVKVKGTKDQPLIAKAANGFEKRIILNGTLQEAVVDISGMAKEAKNSIKEILIFGLAGADGQGSFEVHDAFMAKDYEISGPTIIKNDYNGTDKVFNLVHWYDNGDELFQITEDENGSTLTYEKGQFNAWSAAATHINGDISNLHLLEVEVTGEAGKKVMFKVEGVAPAKIEKTFDLDGTRQTFVIDLRAMLPSDLKAVNKILVMPSPNVIESGTLTIHRTTLKVDEYDFKEGWVDNDGSIYTFTTENNGDVRVDYVKPAGKAWVFMKHEFGEDMSKYNTLTMVVKGTPGKSILVKPNDMGQLEKTIEFTTEEPVIFTTPLDNPDKILIFAEGGVDDTAGSFTILEAYLSYVAPDAVDRDEIVNVNTGWIDNDGGIYTMTQQSDGSYKFDVDRPSNKTWAFIKTVFEQDLSNHNTIELTFKGDAGKELLFKPNDKNKFEHWVTLTGEVQTLSIPLDEAPRLLIVFFAPRGEEPTLTGSFEIISAKVTYNYAPVDFTDDQWVDNDGGIYTFTEQEDGSLKVDYNKENKDWAFMVYNFPTDLPKYNTLTMVLTGTPGKKVLVKANNAIERWVEFVDENPVTVTITADSFTSCLLFAEGGVATAQGSFTIVSAELTKVFAPIDINHDWVDNDGGIYTFAAEEGKVVVSFTRTDGQQWAFIKNVFEGNLARYHTFEFVVKGEAGQELLFKPNDKNKFEKWVTLTGEEQTITITIDETPTKLLMFYSPRFAEPVLEGTFEIISAVLKP